MAEGKTPLTRAELDQGRCDTPGCTEDHGELWLHGRCHPRAKQVVSYSHGVVTVRCAICRKVVALIEVASGPAGPA